MDICLLVAFDENRLIGSDNQLPWHLPADLKHFKNLTMGHHMIMGRKTYESIGKPLPGRTSVIITHQDDYQAEGCIVCHSLEEAYHTCASENRVFVIGGAQVFKESMKDASHLYTTVIHHAFDGDTWFPEIDPAEWKEVLRERHSADDKNVWDYTYINYERR